MKYNEEKFEKEFNIKGVSIKFFEQLDDSTPKKDSSKNK